MKSSSKPQLFLDKSSNVEPLVARKITRKSAPTSTSDQNSLPSSSPHQLRRR